LSKTPEGGQHGSWGLSGKPTKKIGTSAKRKSCNRVRSSEKSKTGRRQYVRTITLFHDHNVLKLLQEFRKSIKS
jgi:hypothetical protein